MIVTREEFTRSKEMGVAKIFCFGWGSNQASLDHADTTQPAELSPLSEYDNKVFLVLVLDD